MDRFIIRGYSGDEIENTPPLPCKPILLAPLMLSKEFLFFMSEKTYK